MRADIFHYVSPVPERRYEAGPPGTGELEQTRHGLGRHSPRGFHLDVKSSASHVQSENRGASVRKEFTETNRCRHTGLQQGPNSSLRRADRLHLNHL